jgi:hypothetical protein
VSHPRYGEISSCKRESVAASTRRGLGWPFS